jgi:TATA-box binding protein (TBP) (component of TFIID and TFIIIB)
MRSESRAQTSPPHSSRKVASISRCCHAVLVLAKDGWLADLGVIEEDAQTGFTVENVVCTAMLEDLVSLNVLAIGLGLEVTEYEPEQFPGLVYRPEEVGAVLMVFPMGIWLLQELRTSIRLNQRINIFSRKSKDWFSRYRVSQSFKVIPAAIWVSVRKVNY